MFQAACTSNPDDEEALRAIDLLFDTASVSSGFTVSVVPCISFLNRGYGCNWITSSDLFKNVSSNL